MRYLTYMKILWKEKISFDKVLITSIKEPEKVLERILQKGISRSKVAMLK